MYLIKSRSSTRIFPYQLRYFKIQLYKFNIKSVTLFELFLFNLLRMFLAFGGIFLCKTNIQRSVSTRIVHFDLATSSRSRSRTLPMLQTSSSPSCPLAVTTPIPPQKTPPTWFLAPQISLASLCPFYKCHYRECSFSYLASFIGHYICKSPSCFGEYLRVIYFHCCLPSHCIDRS